ncbi:protein-L-isoaspartate O-methyltransferase family protein [Aurantiacibacter hainanensis]|uniref:protein-L-isoaspartate O-methyltransferase family protein n=1 Tax=Aurantiacibacter hainanensis TaxID=3076114 RepID=UPI0030C664B1
MISDLPANDTGNRARRAMIDSQLRTSGVNAPFVIRRMSQVAREDFVPAASKGVAYVDRAIRLENGAWLPAPVVHGKMLEEANPDGDEKAIVVDAGSGYLAELFRPLVAELTILSPEEAVGKGTKGKGADLLVIDGAVEEIPAGLGKRLADGARIVTGMVGNGVTRIAVGRKTESGVSLMPVYDVGIPQLHEFDKPKGWSF